MFKHLIRGAALLALVSGLAASFTSSASAADSKTVTVGYQTDIEPSKIAQAGGLYEKASGYKINWRKFNTGADVIAAMASGDLAGRIHRQQSACRGRYARFAAGNVFRCSRDWHG